MIGITGAKGHLGQLVVQGLLQHVAAEQVVAAVRDTRKADTLRALGVQVREGDYDRPETLATALKGVEKLLLISAVVPGQRLRQHQAVIDAAREAGVKLVAYTSILRADTSNLLLAEEHRLTEEYLKNSGLDFVLLRNGWYLENHTAALGPALAHGAILGSAGNGKFASASRADYAGAAVTVLTQAGHANQTYELAGEPAYTLEEFAAEVAELAGKPVIYNDLPPSEYEAALLSFGLPKMIVDVLVDADLKAQKGELDSTSSDLSKLLGRPTMPYEQAIRAAIAS